MLFVYLIIVNDSLQDDTTYEGSDAGIQQKVSQMGKRKKNIQNFKFEKTDYMKFLETNKFFSEETELQFLNNENKFISWRKSKVSKKSVESFLDELQDVDIYSITMIINQQLQQSLKQITVEGERIYHKIIT